MRLSILAIVSVLQLFVLWNIQSKVVELTGGQSGDSSALTQNANP